MQKYIALLRGINVSGQKLIKMEALRKSLERLRFEKVSTYIQSGNILFESSGSDVAVLQSQIKELIQTDFGFDVPVVIITLKELLDVVSSNPYANSVLSDPAQPYVSFLSAEPSKEALSLLQEIDFGKDEFTSHKRWLYILYASAASTKLSNSFIERKLNVTATSRNWKTVTKLIALSSAE